MGQGTTRRYRDRYLEEGGSEAPFQWAPSEPQAWTARPFRRGAAVSVEKT
jgi:hypothetical protein